MGRIQGLAESGLLTTSALIKSGKGEIHSISVAWVGATVGHYCLLRDGLNNEAPPLLPFPFATANGFIHKEWPQGKVFDTGLYYHEGASGVSPSHVWVEITFK